MDQTDNIRQARRELAIWAARQTDDWIRSRCAIIRSNLRRLEIDPDNMPLRVITKRNVAELAALARDARGIEPRH